MLTIPENITEKTLFTTEKKGTINHSLTRAHAPALAQFLNYLNQHLLFLGMGKGMGTGIIDPIVP